MKPSSITLVALMPFLAVGGFGVFSSRQQASLPGTYHLVTIDGHALPYSPSHADRPSDAPPPPVVLGSVLTVDPDTSFHMSMSYRVTRQGKEEVMERAFSGTYVADGPGYRFSWANAGQTPVTLRGDTLLLDNEGMLFAYLRQGDR
jgi:hypothetical protein